MDKDIPLNIIALLITVGISISLSAALSRGRKIAGDRSLLAFAWGLVLWSLANLLLAVDSIPEKKFWLGASYLGSDIVPAALLTFGLAYASSRRWLTRRMVVLLAVKPVVTQILFWINPQKLWTTLSNSAPVSGMTTAVNLFSRINFLYIDGLLAITFASLIWAFSQSLLPRRMKPGILLAAILFPLLICNLSLADLPVSFGANSMLFAFIITDLILCYVFFSSRLLEVIPISRMRVIESMNDGWMVLDAQNRIVDLNPAAEEIFDLHRNEIIGEPAENYLSDWPSIVENYGNTGELDMRGRMKMRDGNRYLNTRISPLVDGQGQTFGRLVVLRDITERRLAEDARQRARDEMLILLHSISSAASQAQSLDDFLTASIYQIVYSFHSQAGAVFTLDEDVKRIEGGRILLVAHQGISLEGVKKMSSGSEDLELVGWFIKNKEPLIITDMETDPRVPEPMRREGKGAFLVAPMMVDERVVGFIGLIRRQGPAYSAEEVVRLSAVAQDVASYIHGDRQRQLAISLAERQRLMRDLHDSVTQKLYGLVTLIEAAQAGLEAGSAIIPEKILPRIAENARHALKEMRLFLYQLKPVDLEREGLVGTLHQRLAAVEGRSDVKARLLAEDDIPLSLEKEVAFYYIAQEALNNTLEHANAKSVIVRLRQTKVNVILEIEDDGIGFDPKTESTKGGMGLQNMKERALLVGGKLKIASTAGHGTRLTVTIRRDRQPKKNRKK